MAKKSKPNAPVTGESQKDTPVISGTPISEQTMSETLSRWRVYSTSMSMPGQKEREFPPTILTLNFFSHAELNLAPIFKRENLVAGKYYTSYSVLTYKIPSPMTLEEFDSFVEGTGVLKKVFKWIPSEAVQMGRWSCYCPAQTHHPFYKVNVATDDDGKLDTITLVFFEKLKDMQLDINNEITHYLSRGGKFCSDPKIQKIFPALNLPSNQR